MRIRLHKRGSSRAEYQEWVVDGLSRSSDGTVTLRLARSHDTEELERVMNIVIERSDAQSVYWRGLLECLAKL